MDAPVTSFVTREKRKQVALVSLVVLSSAIIAFAPRNERRLFYIPEQPAAFFTMEAPEETSLRSPIMGALFEPGSFGARRPKHRALRPRPEAPAESNVPSAFFAQPEPPLSLEDLDEPLDLAMEPMGTDIPDLPSEPFGVPLPLNSIPLALSGVPEPASWLMLIAGFAAMGGALRKRARPAALSVVR